MYFLMDFLRHGGVDRRLFAPDGGGGNGGGEGNPAPEVKYTDDQVNDMIAKNKGKLLKALGFDDEKAAKEWVTAQRTKEAQGKTEEQKMQEQAAANAKAVKERDEALAKIRQYEQREKVREANVPKQYVDFIAYQAERLVNEQTDFDAALAKYLKDNPQYATTPQNKPAGNTGMPQGGNSGKTAEDAYLEKKYGKNPYYKK